MKIKGLVVPFFPRFALEAKEGFISPESNLRKAQDLLRTADVTYHGEVERIDG